MSSLPRPLDGRPVPVLAAVAAVGSALVVAVPLVLISALTWISAAVHGTGGPVSGALRAGLLAWLAGNHVPIRLDGLPISLSPLGILGAVLLVLFLAGRRLGREIDDARAAAIAALEVVGWYALAVAAVALAVGWSGGRFGANPFLAFVIGACVAVAGAGAGVSAGSTGIRRLVADRLPQWVKSALAGGVAGAAALLTLAALVLAGSLLVGRDRVVALVTAYHGSSALELIGFGLLNLSLVPNAVGFVAAYLLGPGFLLGSSTLVSPQVVDLAEMPALPLLGAVPAEGVPPLSLAVVFGAAVLSAVVAVVVTARCDRAAGVDWRRLSFDEAALRPAAAGLVAAVILVAVMALAGGGLGSGRLSFLGPDLLPAAALAVALFGLLGAAGGALCWIVSWLGRRADV